MKKRLLVVVVLVALVAMMASPVFAADKKLMHHRWSEPKQALADPMFWGGGNGWTAAAFARAIRSLPPDRQAERARLAAMLRELLDGCLAHQRPDGRFHDEVDNPSSYVETNLAAMLAYAIYESVRGGWLPEDYLVHADRMRAAVRAKVDRFGFVQELCLRNGAR